MALRTRYEEFKVSMRPRLKEWRFMLKRIRGTPLAFVGLIIILFYVGIAVLAPVLAPPPTGDAFSIPQDTELFRLSPNPIPPTYRHIFGTTDQQYDLYYACIWGTITAFRTGLLVVGISLLIGLSIGTVAAYYGGLFDEALMRLTDIVIAFPGLVLAMALVIAVPVKISLDASMILLVLSILVSLVFLSVRPQGRRIQYALWGLVIAALILVLYYPQNIAFNVTRLDKVLIAITLVGWPGYTRVIRGEVLRVKNEDYVEASRASGSSDSRIVLRHIWPNTVYPILIVATLDIGSIVLTAAAMSFIGLGAEADFADWGQIIQRSAVWISQPAQLLQNYHTFLIPGLFITFFVMGWNLLGDALRDVLDPMLRRR